MDNLAVSDAIKDSFSFLLEEHGCQICKEEADEFGVFVTYSNQNAGLRVSYEPREGGVFVMIFPCQDGEIPAYRDWYDFLDFLTTVGKSLGESDVHDLENPDPKVFQEMIGRYARLVRSHLGSYLSGDFSVSSELKAIVNYRKEGFRSS
jgi:hypothetical protein